MPNSSRARRFWKAKAFRPSKSSSSDQSPSGEPAERVISRPTKRSREIRVRPEEEGRVIRVGKAMDVVE